MGSGWEIYRTLPYHMYAGILIPTARVARHSAAQNRSAASRVHRTTHNYSILIRVNGGELPELGSRGTTYGKRNRPQEIRDKCPDRQGDFRILGNNGNPPMIDTRNVGIYVLTFSSRFCG